MTSATGPLASSSSTSSTASTSTTLSQTTGDSYSYSASSQVKVLSVKAIVSGGQPGTQTVTFMVQYENIGPTTIYALGVGQTGLIVDNSTGTANVQKIPKVQCEIVMAPYPLTPGDNTTASTPTCSNGFAYEVLQAGSLGVQFTLSWYPSSDLGGQKVSIQITAEFYVD